MVTPLRPGAITEKLRSLGLLEDWQAVVDGLTNGFDVGVSVPILRRVVHRNHGSSEWVGSCH